jgi:hypothetical protein
MTLSRSVNAQRQFLTAQAAGTNPSAMNYRMCAREMPITSTWCWSEREDLGMSSNIFSEVTWGSLCHRAMPQRKIGDLTKWIDDAEHDREGHDLIAYKARFWSIVRQVRSPNQLHENHVQLHNIGCLETHERIILRVKRSPVKSNSSIWRPFKACVVILHVYHSP